MFESCISCQKVGNSCRGPRITEMHVDEAITLMKARKKFLGLSNQQLADRSHAPKGTVDGIFAATHSDFRYETIRPVWNALFSGDASGNPCPDLADDERANYEEIIRQLKKDIVWHEDKIQHLQKNNESLQTLITNTNTRNTQDKDFLRSQIKSKNKAIVVLSVSLALCLLVIITALIIDRANSGIGFFWLESLFKPHGVTEIIQQWRT